MIFQLTDEIAFPDPHLGEEEGIFAIGGDLRPERLYLGYCHGIFPWYSFKEGQIQWWCPMKRFVIFPSEIHISHSMRQMINSGRYCVTFNRCFERVIRHCSEINNRHEQVGAWLGDDMIAAYTRLHKLGVCSSVEVWEETAEDKQLIGGLYGVTVGKSFIGESMFSLKPSGSKLALISLAQFMEEKGLDLIDCQMETDHLKSMGARYIPYDEYLTILQRDL